MPARDEISLFVERLNAVGAEYMITGATAAILYGQPRVTNDIDVVLALRDEQVAALLHAFPESEFYIPPTFVIRVEMARRHRGHFNIIHHDTGFKADVYLAGSDPLHAWALPRRRPVDWTDAVQLYVAPPEYVILRKLEYFREGGSSKHPADVRAILAATTVDVAAIEKWARRLGLEEQWAQVRLTGPGE
jgi:hypothetical protein